MDTIRYCLRSSRILLRSRLQYPIDIYPKPMRLLFGFVVPFALTPRLPVSYLLGRPLLGLSPLWAFLSPLAGPAFFCLTLFFWRWGVSHYRSTGS